MTVIESKWLTENCFVQTLGEQLALRCWMCRNTLYIYDDRNTWLWMMLILTIKASEHFEQCGVCILWFVWLSFVKVDDMPNEYISQLPSFLLHYKLISAERKVKAKSCLWHRCCCPRDWQTTAKEAPDHEMCMNDTFFPYICAVYQSAVMVLFNFYVASCHLEQAKGKAGYKIIFKNSV